MVNWHGRPESHNSFDHRDWNSDPHNHVDKLQEAAFDALRLKASQKQISQGIMNSDLPLEIPPLDQLLPRLESQRMQNYAIFGAPEPLHTSNITAEQAVPERPAQDNPT